MGIGVALCSAISGTHHRTHAAPACNCLLKLSCACVQATLDPLPLERIRQSQRISSRWKMAGRQYNMYNVQNAESWKQRVCKENLHNAPTFSALAGSTADDDAVSVSSVGSGMSGRSGMSGGSKASVASTAALKRVRSLPLLTPGMASRPAARHRGAHRILQLTTAATARAD